VAVKNRGRSLDDAPPSRLPAAGFCALIWQYLRPIGLSIHLTNIYSQGVI
jgi:hypothetical protein